MVQIFQAHNEVLNFIIERENRENVLYYVVLQKTSTRRTDLFDIKLYITLEIDEAKFLFFLSFFRYDIIVETSGEMVPIQ